MERNLVIEILEYNRDKDIFLTNDQIEELFLHLIEHYEVEEYVNNLSFVDEYPNHKLSVNAEYDFINKNISIFERNIKNTRRITLQGEYTLEDKTYKKVFANEVVLQILIHEIIHAMHIKLLFESKDYDLEFEILRSAYVDEFIRNPFKLAYLKDYYGTSIESYFGSEYYNFKKQLKTYDKRYFNVFYEIDPSELSAEYLSYKEIIYLNELLNPDLNKDWKDLLYLNTQAIYTPIEKRVISPFEKFITKRDNILTLDRFDTSRLKTEKLPYDTRLCYGLPISKKEFNDIEKHIMSLHL